MPKTIEGNLSNADDRFAIVVARFNQTVTGRLLSGAFATFRDHGVSDERITVVWVPGAFEIPLVADRLAKSGKYAAVCCLGAVIQGETTHHEYINQQVSSGIMQAARESGVPVLYGVLNCQSLSLALARAGGQTRNKGGETALAAMQMADLLKKLDENGS